MRAVQRLSFAVICLACLLPAYGVRAQISLDAPGLLPKKPKPGPPAVQAPTQAWPRLDPGAVLCRTEVDLERLAANRTGGPGGGPADCRLVSRPTPIKIVHRKGPGSTEVQVTGGRDGKTGETGWTDSWLPPRPPSAVR